MEPSESNKQGALENSLIEKLRSIVLENLQNEQFGVNTLAKEAGVSRSHLHRKIKKIRQQSLSRFICEIRLKEAHELLQTGTYTSAEVAYKTGFNNPSYFSACYHKYYGFSPGKTKDQIVENGIETEKTKSSSKTTGKKIYLLILAGIFLIILMLMGVIVYTQSGNTVEQKSIAILPFDNLSSNIENQYFADGIVEDLLTRLSKIEELKVISRTSSEMFREKGNKTISEISKILGVNYILEGSIQRESNKVRISIQLIDAERDDHLFSQQYSRDLNDIFKIQGDIASQIVDELSVLLSDRQLEEIKKIHTRSLKAMDYYNIGHLNYCFCTEESVKESVYYLKKAIQADSAFALPYARLALSYRYLSHTDYFSDATTGRDSAEILAYKALELDNKLADAHVALGFIYLTEDLDLERCVKEFKKALQLNPNSAEACTKYADFLKQTGEIEKAREYMNKAIQLDPFNITTRYNSTWLYIAEGDLQKALEENKKSLEISGDNLRALNLRFYIYLWMGRNQEAYEFARYTDQIIGKYPLQEIDSAYQNGGTNGIIRLHISRSTNFNEKTHWYLHLREIDHAMDELELAHAQGKLDRYMLFQVLKRTDIDLSTNPRFNRLLNEYGMEGY